MDTNEREFGEEGTESMEFLTQIFVSSRLCPAVKAAENRRSPKPSAHPFIVLRPSFAKPAITLDAPLFSHLPSRRRDLDSYRTAD